MIEEKDGNPSHCFRQAEAKNLQHHPHVHYIVPAGGLAADGCGWIDSSRRFFLPVKALSKIFRDKFSDELRELFQQDRLQFHNSLQQLASSGGFNHFLWQLGRKEATFADVRSYIYHGKKIDQQVHLGYDLAVTQHVGVEASNDGRVVWAAPLGIYGNCIVVDQGYGLQTIYGHMSRIDVHEGDTVKRSQIMGLSGMTGMAGGDHVHFAMQLDGVQIDPKEWWDAH